MVTTHPYTLEPSVICCDLCNLEVETKRLKEAGITALHIDVLDGAFSPSLPVGVDTFIELAHRTDLPFDVHVMSNNNEWFIDKCIEMKPDRICFQCEGEKHIARMVSKIRAAGISPGIAFAPATPLDAAGYALYDSDFILLMRIEPGYASVKNEKKFSFMRQKIQESRHRLDAIHPSMGIVIDGRVSFEDIPELISDGADTLVCGSKSIFVSKDYAANYEKARIIYNKAMEEYR